MVPESSGEPDRKPLHHLAVGENSRVAGARGRHRGKCPVRKRIPDFLVALHASRSHEVDPSTFARRGWMGKLVVALTGSDIYPEPDAKVLESIERGRTGWWCCSERPSSRSQNRIAKKRGSSFNPRSGSGVNRIRYESHARCLCGRPSPRRERSDARGRGVAPVAGRVEDPVLHAGGIHEPKYRDLVEQEIRERIRATDGSANSTKRRWPT